MTKLRTVEILRAGVWYNEGFEDIQKGDVFRMFDPPDDTPVIDSDGNTMFKADSEVYKRDKDGVLTVNIIEAEGSDEDLGIYHE